MSEIKSSLKGQYGAVLQQLRQCIESCPQDVWLSGTHPRTFWRIAHHAAFYTHLYLMPQESDFVRFGDVDESVTNLWGDDNPVIEPLSRQFVLDYVAHIVQHLGDWVERIDLDQAETGFHWYKKMDKLDHQIMNVRHTATHVGQLQELLMAHGIDTDWVGKHPR